jgi:uncharacterized membrane protein SpoIIM required for sporulation
LGRAPRSVDFRKQREREWQELANLVDLALKKGLSALNADALRRLPVLYRSALSSLAVARKTAMDRALVSYLEGLAGRAYLVVYGSRRPTRGVLRRIFLEELPRLVRRMAPELGLSTLIFALGVGVSFTLVAQDPGWYDAFVSPDLAGGRDPSAKTEELREVLYGGGEHLTTFASFLFTHNAQIGIVAFALGFAAGVPTVLLVFTNGLMLGAFIQLYASRGLLFELMGWLLPHGVPEIGAILLCGAAGMHIGRGLLLPGEHSVRDAMVAAGRRASIVVLGCVLLFAVAGVIEGVFRQSVMNDGARYLLAAFNALWFFGWLFVAGRGPAAGADQQGGTP